MMQDKDTEPINKPEATQSDVLPPNQPSGRRKLGKRAVAAICAAVAVVLVGLAIGAYVSLQAWVNSPQKAFADALKNAFEEPALYTLSNGNDAPLAKLQTGDQIYSAEINNSGSKFTAIIDGSMLYLKTDNVSKLFEMATGTEPSPAVEGFVGPMLSSLSGKWFSFDLKTSMLQNTTTRQASCGVDSFNSLMADGANREALASAYVRNQFVDVKDLTKQGSDLTYKLTVDRVKLQGFLDGVQQTSFYQKLASCGEVDPKVFELPKSSTDWTATVVLTTDHKFKKIILGTAPKPVTVTVARTGLQHISAPRDATSLDSMFSGIFGSFLQGLPTSAAALPQ